MVLRCPVKLVIVATIAVGVIAVIRRIQAHPESKFDVTETIRSASKIRSLFDAQSMLDRVLSILIVASLITIIFGSVLIANSVDGRESYTEFYLFSENESEGRVAAEYPTVDSSNGQPSIVIGIGNHEDKAVNYSIVVQLARPGNMTNTLQRDELDRFHTTVAASETQEIDYTIPVEIGRYKTGNEITFLLYKDSPPENPSPDTAYRSVHIQRDTSSTE